ncbi:hypothetical protein Xtri_19980 [Xanthomonas campestris pv. trichodesmae]|uniref:Uncharacterized protein n=2 Tax=Xanthomonas citri TaxID=346 RepID=A0AB33CMJ2_XANCI|nr:hypothetical protein XcvCFBP7111P_25680 [Xanthomonas citri pv. vignicola]ASK94899.1 hypothetical protein XcvCFBP7111P_25955 [Xanthomonas citri pv. vignicola]MBZ3921981.1 hypothetical protein [Xanthomonas campestris pv. trichodesmae]MBZ3925800.1 hypothetical protein [Xanthomonas citri pv. sesbaniae]
MARPRAKPLKPGQVWIAKSDTGRSRMRRVVALVEDRVCYSTGSDLVHWCNRRAFQMWISTHRAIRSRSVANRKLILDPRPRK